MQPPALCLYSREFQMTYARFHDDHQLTRFHFRKGFALGFLQSLLKEFYRWEIILPQDKAACNRESHKDCNVHNQDNHECATGHVYSPLTGSSECSESHTKNFFATLSRKFRPIIR